MSNDGTSATAHHSVDTAVDPYWRDILLEAERLPLAPELVELPIRSGADYTTFGVRYTSVGPYRIFAYYSVPMGNGPFPALAFLPGYGSVVSPAPAWARGSFATMSVCVRGTRHSDVPYAARFPGAFTEGITDPEQYMYRGVVVDCCRAVAFLLEQEAVYAQRVALLGDGIGGTLALLVAALEPWVAYTAVAGPVLVNPRQSVPAVDAYPLGEVGDLLRAHPEHAEVVWNTLDHFDPMHHLPLIRGHVLLNSNGVPSDTVGRFTAELETRLDVVDLGGYHYGKARVRWLREHLLPGLE